MLSCYIAECSEAGEGGDEESEEEDGFHKTRFKTNAEGEINPSANNY